MFASVCAIESCSMIRFVVFFCGGVGIKRCPVELILAAGRHYTILGRILPDLGFAKHAQSEFQALPGTRVPLSFLESTPRSRSTGTPSRPVNQPLIPICDGPSFRDSFDLVISALADIMYIMYLRASDSGMGSPFLFLLAFRRETHRQINWTHPCGVQGLPLQALNFLSSSRFYLCGLGL